MLVLSQYALIVRRLFASMRLDYSWQYVTPSAELSTCSPHRNFLKIHIFLEWVSRLWKWSFEGLVHSFYAFSGTLTMI